MGWQIGIDVSVIRDQSTVTIIRDGRFVETRHITKPMVLTDWPYFISEMASDLVGPIDVRIDARGVGRALYDVFVAAGWPVTETGDDLKRLIDEKLKLRGLV